MILALDVDITFKLYALGLFDEAIQALGSMNDVRVLAQAKYSNGSRMPAKRRKSRIGRFGEAAVHSACTLFDSAKEIEPGDKADIDKMAEIERIDPGEQALIASAAQDDTALMLTGDKNCIGALSDPKISDIRDRLLGRIICLEGILIKLIETHGFACVRGRVIPRMQCDTAVCAAFGSGMLAMEANVVNTLTAYLPTDRRLLKIL